MHIQNFHIRFEMNAPQRFMIVATLALVAAIAISSCLFDTRDAQEPGVVTGGCTLESPGKAFVCMTGAIASQQDADYERTMSETFLFSPTQEDSLDQNFSGTEVFTLWDKPTELQALGLLFSDADHTSVDFGTTKALINKNTFVRFETNYTLSVITDNPADTTLYKGQAWIDVRNEGGNWRVTYWDERATVPGFHTWGFLRGILGLRFRP
jgi:hypothetical protein